MGTLPWPPSPISGYSCLFATEVVRIFYHCCSIYSPTSTFILPLLCCRPPPPLTTCCSLLSQDVKSVPFSFWFTTSVMSVCMCSVSIYPAVHVAFDVRDRLVFKKRHVSTLLLPFPMSFICRIFFVHIFFCFVPVRM